MRGWCGVARDSSRAKRARSARARRLRARTHAVRHHSRVSARHLGCRDPAPGDTIAQRAPSQPSPSPVPQSPCRVLSSAEKRPGSRQDIRQPLNIRRNTDERKRQKRRRVVRCGVQWWSVQTPTLRAKQTRVFAAFPPESYFGSRPRPVAEENTLHPRR
jgi:hypothetical protein